jgi:hypothetical protein
VEGRLHPGHGDARPNGRPAGRDRRATDEAEGEDRDVLRDPLVADEPPIEAAPLPAGQDLAREVEGIEACVAEDRRAEPDVDARQRDLVEDGLAALAAECQRERQVAERRDVRMAPK